jgi:FixJ family two-component response regulator
VSTLTPREREVMDLVIDGKANKQIAGALGLSEKTIEVHRSRVMRKMQATNAADLIRMVLEARAV